MKRNLLSPDPLLLTWSERLETWLWSRRRAHALLGWLLLFSPERGETDDLADVLKFLGIVTLCAAGVGLGVLAGLIR